MDFLPIILLNVFHGLLLLNEPRESQATWTPLEMMLRLLRCVHLTWLNFRCRWFRVWKVFLKVLLRYDVLGRIYEIGRDFWLNFWSGKFSKFHWFELIWGLGQNLILHFLVILVNLVTPISWFKVASLHLWLNFEHFIREQVYGWLFKFFRWQLSCTLLRKHITSTICCFSLTIL